MEDLQKQQEEGLQEQDQQEQQKKIDPDFYVITQNGVSPELYVVDYNPVTRQVTFGNNIDAAIWSDKSQKIDQFIAHNNLTNVATTGKNGDHPTQKPPL